MTSDLVRHEATYHHGGFYFDLNWEILKPVLDKWRSYKFVDAG